MKRPVWTLTALILMASAVPAAAQTRGRTLPAIARTRSDLNLFLDLQNQLMVAARQSENTMPEYRSEVVAYQQARDLAKDPAVWRIVSDACVIGPDIKAIGKAVESLPITLAEPDRLAATKMIEALVSAWPRFEARDMIERRRSLQSVLVKVIRRRFSEMLEERIMTTLYEKMDFKPLDAPITIYPVLNATEAGTWGRTAQGYYLVVPSGRLPQLIVIENIVHELTHLLDSNQPPGTKDFLVRFREKATGTDAETLDAFMHGLVSWNAGEMIKRFGTPEHQTYADLSPERRAKIERFLPSYRTFWVGYLDGKLSADQALDGLVAAMKALPVKPAPGAGSGR
ncbi:MAG TPA: hypothetical protein VGK94_02775 [Candidatus Polarisedimenticolia bacterium]|jgi:hypothetical protein